MQHPNRLLTHRFRPIYRAEPCRARRGAIRQLMAGDGAFLSLMLWALVHASEACAGDAAPTGTSQGKRDVDLSGMPSRLSTRAPPLPPSDSRQPAGSRLPFDFRLPAEIDKPFSTDFSPRGPSIVATDPKEPSGDDRQHGSVWQRLGEFRTHNRLRLLTLWQTGGNSLSLQAGRRGDPTLQWTSRLSHRQAENGGLFDDLFSTSTGGAIGKGLHLLPHFSPFESPAKPAKSSEMPISATASGN